MKPRLRQVAVVARELAPVVADLREVFGIEVAFNDPGVGMFGLDNAVFAVGDTFLEVVSPREPDTTAGRLLDKRGGDGGYMVIVQVADELEAHRARMHALGVRIVWEIELEDMATLHLHPRDVGGAILSLDVARPPESWRWGGPAWKSAVRTDRVRSIVGVEIEASDPSSMARRWAAVIGVPHPRSVGDMQVVELFESELRFVPISSERGEGLARVILDAPDGAAILANARSRSLSTIDNAVRVGGVWFEWAR